MSTLRRSLVATASLWVLVACTPVEPNPGFDSGNTIYCSTSSECPTPLFCIDFVCRPAPPDAGVRDYGSRDRRPDAVLLDRPASDAAAGLDASSADALATDGAQHDVSVKDAAVEDALAEDS